jgi:flagellin
MAQIINTNIPSLNAQRNLTNSQSALATSLQRLSSGMRINSAKDDAAGLAISERFSSQIRGINQAIRNANDGVSLAQTGEGALAEVTSNLQRIRELAVQSVNSTNSSSDRAALDLEVQQRLAEIDRTATQTSFNSLKILDGTFGTSTFQVGANVAETISVNLATSMRTTSIGKTADYVNGTVSYDSAVALGQQGTGVSAAVTATGDGGVALAALTDLSIVVGSNAAVAIGASADNSAGAGNAGRTAGSAYSKALAINAASVPNLTTTADTTVVFAYADILTAADAGDDYTLTINGQGVYTALTTGATGTQMAAKINQTSGATGVTATFDTTSGNITLNAMDGRNIVITQTATDTDGDSTLAKGLTTTPNALNNTANAALVATTAVSTTSLTVNAVGTIRLTSTEAINLSGANEAYIGYANNSSMALGASALNSASVTSVANANTMIARVDSALATVSTLRSTFGAIQNRFESVTTSLAATSENLTSARSRILDADYAQETAALTRNQILQQAGIAMLSQANQLPNTVLSLLK